VARIGTRSARTLAGCLLLILVLTACESSASTYPYRWDLFFQSIFQPSNLILNGVALTLGLSVVSQLIGTILGVLGALGRLSKFAPARWFAGFYVWFFRGTPLLVQIAFIYFGFGVAGIYQWERHPLFGIIPGAWQAGVVALALNEGAYMTEIVRAGILSVDAGQMEAAKSLGMTYRRAMRRIVLPQAARIIVPPLGNEFNNMLKTTSLLAFIGVRELFQDADIRYSSTFKPVEYFAGVAILYLCLTTIWGFIQMGIERRLGQSDRDETVSLRMRLSGIAGRAR
jgi:polar amino acid transport system permease protein